MRRPLIGTLLILIPLMVLSGCNKDSRFSRTVGQPASQQMMKEKNRMSHWAREANLRNGTIKLKDDQMLIDYEFEKGEYKNHLKVTFVIVNQIGIIEKIKIYNFYKKNGKFQILASVPYYPHKFLYHEWELS